MNIRTLKGDIVRRTYLTTLVVVSTLIAGAFATSAQAERGFGTEPDRSTPEAGPRKGRIDDLAARWVDGEVLVTFRRGVRRADARSMHRALGARVLERVRLGASTDLVRLPSGVGTEQGLQAYAADPAVASVEPNLIRTYTNHVPATPNDLFFGEYWGLHNTGQAHAIADPPPASAAGTPLADMNVPEAWQVPHSFVPVIAVMDSGVDITHPDLAGQLWTNPGEIPADGIDNDGNGCIDDVNGCNFASSPRSGADLSDAIPHGTHVAGTIAAATNNGPLPENGGAGVCPQCRIMVLKLGASPTLAGQLAASQYAIAMGAHVVNMSFGGPVWSQGERNAMLALQNANILSAVAAGNASLDNDMFLQGPGDSSPSFPASYNLDGIISVAASNHHDEYGTFTGCVSDGVPKDVCAFSSWGHDSVDVAAPGVDILSTVPTFFAASRFAVFNGTSMATPHVAGVAGLLKSVNPALTAVQIKNAIMNSSARPASLLTMHSALFRRGKAGGHFTRTSGRADAQAALATTDYSSFGPSFQVATPPTDGNIDGARRINRNKRGRVAYPHDINDVYVKRLRKGKRYEVVLDVPKRRDFDLWVWKPKTQEIWQLEGRCLGFGPGRCMIQGSSTSGKGRDEIVTFKARKSGKYYFQVSSWIQNKGRYRLSIRQL